MSIRTLFTIILKVLGLLVAKDFILVIPQFLTLLSFTLQSNGQTSSLLISVLLSIVCYSFVSYSLLFKTDLVIDKFGLDQGFEVDAVRLAIHRSTVLSIVIIIISALMIINAVPILLNYFIKFSQVSATVGSGDKAGLDWAFLVLYSLQIVIGLLGLGYQRQLVNFLELKQRRNNNSISEAETDDDNAATSE